MIKGFLATLFLAALAEVNVVQGQTRVRLSAIIPGTEKVQLVQNGDFQFQGPEVNGSHPNPTGWNRQGEMFVGLGANTIINNGGSVALARVNASSPTAGLYTRVVRLEANTAYVFSAYLWNFGNAANRVTTVIDFADAPNEPQIILAYSDISADQGYFVYRNFTSADTGTNVTLRVFYDGLTGGGASPTYAPVAAQWDNLAITKAVDFQPPQAAGSGANLRPIVTIANPQEAMSFVITNAPASMRIDTTASDGDGSVVRVEFYTNGTRLGETGASPFSFFWTNVTSGNWQLTAVATDNLGDSTISAPVAVTATVLIPPAPIQLAITNASENLILSWPTSATALSLQSALKLANPISWVPVTNIVTVSNDQVVVTAPPAEAQRYFRLGFGVDPSTMRHKLLMGYQGWFACPGDGSTQNSWVHWFGNNSPTAESAGFDFWPDTSELESDELFATSMTYSNGAPAKLYSAYKQKTVARHFKWMKDNNLDGVFLQRFLSDLSGANISALRNQVAMNVRVGAETYGRVFAIMYDISGYSTNSLVSKLTNDWLYMVNTQHITNSPAYLHHEGKPVVAIWGFGFSGRSDTPQQAQQAINWFKAAGCTVMGGVPSNWRTLNGDAQSNPDWAAAFRSFDVISPWSVGRYGNNSGADTYRVTVTAPDFADCASHGIDYLPVVFPGFSWTNLNGGPFNQIPRNGGNFYWRQVFNALRSGCSMIYGAMFDEVDEGTAMFKMAPTRAQLPTQGSFVPLDVDGYALPSDWYLRLADQAAKMLRGDIPLQSQMPITPPLK